MEGHSQGALLIYLFYLDGVALSGLQKWLEHGSQGRLSLQKSPGSNRDPSWLDKKVLGFRSLTCLFWLKWAYEEKEFINHREPQTLILFEVDQLVI